ncbi:putative reverse transcriptase domain-containing protein, partial [Tanacetum coccineum]
MESLFHISNCATNCQVKFSTCTLSDSALRWWNSHVKKVRIEMSWKELMKMMIKVYCPRNKIQMSWKELMKMMMLLVIFNVFKSWLCYALIMVSDEEKKIERVRVNSARQVENKRRRESNQGNNRVQQPPPKRQNVAIAYTVGSNEKCGYVGKAPFCNN